MGTSETATLSDMRRLVAAAESALLRAMMILVVAAAERGLRRAFARRATRTT